MAPVRSPERASVDPEVKTMIACAQCRTTNTLDSMFCRRCGTALAHDILVEARAELDALVTKGTEAFEDGRADDAMAIAEEAVLTDPTHANAHALKGMIHERRGEVAKALEEYERVCDLSPDSALDRIRLSGLRHALAERATATPDRRTPLIAGVSAAVLLACVGIAAAKMTAGARPAADASATSRGFVAATDVPAGSDASPVASRAAAPKSNGTLLPGDVAPVGSEAPTAAANDAPALPRTGSGGAALPRPRSDRPGGLSGSMPEIEIAPAQIPGGPIGTGLPNPGGPTYPVTPATRTATSRPLDPAPRAQDPAPRPADSGPSAPRTGRRNDGVIDISVEKGSGSGGGGNGGGGATEPSGNGAEALTRVGKAHAQGGDFDRAARSYERALAAGADPATTNQRLGQAYDRMGRKADAKAAYGRSAEGYRRKIASGKADDRDKNGLDSVTQAMKVLDRG